MVITTITEPCRMASYGSQGACRASDSLASAPLPRRRYLAVSSREGNAINLGERHSVIVGFGTAAPNRLCRSPSPRPIRSSQMSRRRSLFSTGPSRSTSSPRSQQNSQGLAVGDTRLFGPRSTASPASAASGRMASANDSANVPLGKVTGDTARDLAPSAAYFRRCRSLIPAMPPEYAHLLSY